MSFADLYNEVLTIRFGQENLVQAQRWVNEAYGRIWNTDEWIFKYGRVTNLTTTAGQNTLGSLPADLGIPLGLWRDDGYPVLYMPPRDFWNTWAAFTDTGSPQWYTLIDQQIFLGPTAKDSLNTYQMVYEKRWLPLVNDTDQPAVPAEHHYLIVSGALSTGMRLYNDFTWEFQEQAFQQGIQEMRREWLIDQRGEATQWGRDQIEALPTAWGV